MTIVPPEWFETSSEGVPAGTWWNPRASRRK
jgi:hypothetical protein